MALLPAIPRGEGGKGRAPKCYHGLTRGSAELTVAEATGRPPHVGLPTDLGLPGLRLIRRVAHRLPLDIAHG